MEKARQEWDRHDVDGGGDGSTKAQKGKKAKRAEELAAEMGKTEYKQTASEKWWDGKKPGDGEDDGDDAREAAEDEDEEEEDDEDPATKARRARSAAAEALEAEMNDEERLRSIRERIATSCQGVLEDPEGKWTDLRDVVKLVEDYDPEVARLSALSMAGSAVYPFTPPPQLTAP